MARKLLVKVRDRSLHEDCEYKNEIDMSNPKLIALVLLDLEQMFHAPIKKACSMVLSDKKVFPF